MSDSPLVTIRPPAQRTPSRDLSWSVTDPGPVITDTHELRWFAPGCVPVDVVTWFNPGADLGAVERRVDTYRLEGRTDVGLKLRHGRILELKIRQSIDYLASSVGDHLDGPIEGWRRWSPADGLVEFDADDPWVEVTKAVVKRRFLDDGVEIGVDPEPPRTSFCDVEVAALELDGVPWWSIGIAAYAETAQARHSMEAARRQLTVAGPPPSGLTSQLGEPRGYPAWLAVAGRSS